MKSILRRLALVSAAVLLFSGAGWAWNDPGSEREDALKLKPDPYHGMEIFRICAKCHYPEGWGRRSGSFPQIAGQHFNVLVKQLADMRERNREAPSMYHFILPEIIGDAQTLTDLAAYISELPMTPANGLGPGTDLEHGKQLYGLYCVKCHGENAEGSDEKFYPRLHGQHYKYMLREFDWIQDRERMNAHPGMIAISAQFTERDAKAVVDYISRIKPPKEDLAPSRKWKNPDFDL